MKSARSWAFVLVALAAAVHIGITRPAQDAAAEAADRYQRSRQEKREASRRLAEVERRADLLERASAVVVASSGGAGREAVQKVRTDVVRSLRESGVARVRLEVRPAAAPAAATVIIQAEAGLFDLLRLTAKVVRPGAGLVLERLSLGTGSSGLALYLEASALAGAS
jgi:hypothetical protein